MNPSSQGIILFYTRRQPLRLEKNKSPDLQTKVDNLHRALEIKIFILSL